MRINPVIISAWATAMILVAVASWTTAKAVLAWLEVVRKSGSSKERNKKSKQ
jgi:hypothetical protein